jgi:hypothetical protein
VDGRALGTRRDRDQIAIPGGELFERREQLLSLDAALRPLHTLLEVALAEPEPLELLLRPLTRPRPRRLHAVDDPARSVGRNEVGVEVNRPRNREQLAASLDRLPVEQPLRAVEAAGRRAGKRRRLLVGQRRGALRQVVAHRALGQPPERDELAARADRLRQRAELARNEDDDGVRRRLLEVLQQRVGRVLVELLGAEHEVHAPLRLERAHVQIAPHLADGVDADHLAQRLQDVEVGMRPPLRARGIAQQLAGEGECDAPLPDAARAVEEVRVRRAVGERGPQEPLRLLLLGYGVEPAHDASSSASSISS